MGEIQIGDKVNICLRIDGRTEEDRAIYRRVKAVVAGIYKHFIQLRYPAGYCECFSWREFQQIRED